MALGVPMVIGMEASPATFIGAKFKKCFGEVSEWLKEHAWKACVGIPTAGSNPALSACIFVIVLGP